MTTEEIKKQAAAKYSHKELGEELPYIVVDRNNYVMAAFYNEWDAEVYKEKFNEQLYVVELD